MERLDKTTQYYVHFKYAFIVFLTSVDFASDAPFLTMQNYKNRYDMTLIISPPFLLVLYNKYVTKLYMLYDTVCAIVYHI